MVKVEKNWTVWNLTQVNYTVLLAGSETDLESQVTASCAERCVNVAEGNNKVVIVENEGECVCNLQVDYR